MEYEPLRTVRYATTFIFVHEQLSRDKRTKNVLLCLQEQKILENYSIAIFPDEEMMRKSD
jgi:hypothetical protein